MDILNGPSEDLNEAGDVYAVSSGRGVAHMEKTASDGENSMIQTIFKIPDENISLEPEISKAKFDSLPVIKLDGGIFRIGVGKVGNHESPVKLKAMPRIVLGRIIIKPLKKVEVPLDEELSQGLLYVLEGEGLVHGKDSSRIANGEHDVFFLFLACAKCAKLLHSLFFCGVLRPLLRQKYSYI